MIHIMINIMINLMTNIMINKMAKIMNVIMISIMINIILTFVSEESATFRKIRKISVHKCALSSLCVLGHLMTQISAVCRSNKSEGWWTDIW